MHIDIFSTFERVIRLSSARYKGNSEERYASATQWSLFSYLHSEQSATISSIAKHLYIKPPTATRLIDRAVKNGQLLRVPSETDRRITYIHMTPTGETSYLQLVAQLSLRTNDVLRHLSANEVATLQKLFDKIASGIESDIAEQQGQTG